MTPSPEPPDVPDDDQHDSPRCRAVLLQLLEVAKLIVAEKGSEAVIYGDPEDSYVYLEAVAAIAAAEALVLTAPDLGKLPAITTL